KSFAAKLKPGLLRCPEFLEEREVEIARAGSAKDGAARIAERLNQLAQVIGHGRRRREGQRVEILIEPRIGDQQRLPQHPVRPVQRVEDRWIVGITEIGRKTLQQSENPIDLPAAKDLGSDTTPSQEPLAG